MVPAIFLTILFFLDHNISVRVVNQPDLGTKKGAAYHLDLFTLGAICAICSVFGMPWMCAATIQSLNHVRSTANAVTVSDPVHGIKEEITDVMETRLTGLGIHFLVLASVLLLPYLRRIPLAVISGIFLYLGRKVMKGNTFLIRIKETISDINLLPATSAFKRLPRAPVYKFTAIQVGRAESESDAFNSPLPHDRPDFVPVYLCLCTVLMSVHLMGTEEHPGHRYVLPFRDWLADGDKVLSHPQAVHQERDRGPR